MRENEVSDPPAIGHAKKRNRRHFPSGPRAAAAPLTNVKLSKSVNPRVAKKPRANRPQLRQGRGTLGNFSANALIHG